MILNNLFSQNSNQTTAQATFLQANWPAPAGVRTLISTRLGGVSQAPFASLNVGMHTGDDLEHVAHNRTIIQSCIPLPLAYLNQTHSTTVVAASDALHTLLDADASFDRSAQVACAVMTADCLPVLFCDRKASVVAAAHAGWRGLAAGVLQNTIHSMGVEPNEIMAFLGPAIGPDAFEVGQDVFDAFVGQNPQAAAAFRLINPQTQQYLADIYQLARLILKQADVHSVYGGEHCTVLERDTFFSYRRDGQTGRMVSAIWLEK